MPRRLTSMDWGRVPLRGGRLGVAWAARDHAGAPAPLAAQPAWLRHARGADPLPDGSAQLDLFRARHVAARITPRRGWAVSRELRRVS